MGGLMIVCILVAIGSLFAALMGMKFFVYIATAAWLVAMFLSWKQGSSGWG